MATGNDDFHRFEENEKVLTIGLCTGGVLLALYLLMAGLGVAWLKWVLAIVACLLSGAGLGSLYLTGEVRRQRSLYLVVGYACIVVCILVSLLTNYPSPAV